VDSKNNARPKGYNVIALGAVLAFLSVAAGAFGAHGAKPLLSEKLFGIYETAVQYQFFHSLALLIVGALLLLPITLNEKRLRKAVICFLLGILLFSGSLYLYAFTGITKLGMITPIGGVCFLLGWLMLGLSTYSTGASQTEKTDNN
jgi:uncharacterized membrane protein YgdD (TMEM256/DUF423 family)